MAYDKEYKAAVDIIRRANLLIEPRAVAELKARDIDASGIKQHTVEPGDIVVCLLRSDPLVLPDNAIAPCNECGATIQFRPYLIGSGAKMCCTFCVLRMVRGDA
jgi:hypothetical protein